MKKMLKMNLIIGMLVLATFTGCSGDSATTPTETPAQSQTETQAPAETPSETPAGEAATGEKMTGDIVVVSREEGSGTRGAFVELIGVVDGDGNDITSFDAIIHSSTGSAMTEVSNTPNAIGYISLGALNDTVKAVDVDGVAPTMENIVSGTYTVARPFNIATKEEPAGLSADFIGFIMSAQGQEIVQNEGLIPLDAADYTTDGSEGSLVVGGSTSVYPVMERLVEAYAEVNPAATISIEGGGSSTGMNNAMDGTFDIGMASRELKDSEKEALWSTAMAQDGIAVIVNNENSTTNINASDIQGIYLGDITEWDVIG